MLFNLRNKCLLVFFIELIFTVNYHVRCSPIEAIEEIGQSENEDLIDTSDEEDSINELKKALGLLFKYQQLLHDNMFHSSAQKKMVLNNYKDLVKTLENFLSENSIDKETFEQLTAELNKNHKNDGSSSPDLMHLKSHLPFKWG